MGLDTYDGCCGSCKWLNTNDYVRTKDNCKCTDRGGYHDLHERACYKYKYDPYKDYYDLNHRWYIVTAILNKLGLSDSYECISLLHNFRKNILEKDTKYNEILNEYDMVGPKIAEKIVEDADSVELCKRLLQVCLTNVLDAIKEENYDEALDLYIQMVNLLKVYFNIDVEEKTKVKIK